MKKKLFVLLVILVSLPNCSYAKSSGTTTCEGLNSIYEDLDCIDASKSGAICDPSEDIISLPRKLQLCCCLRLTDEADSSSDDMPDEGEFSVRKH